MSDLALLAQWALAVVLAISGVAKLVDRAGTADAIVDFGVPERLRWAAPLLPTSELVTAVLLVIPATARVGAFSALALLAAFSIAIAVNLAKGRQPDCNCFGQLGAGPIGRRTLVRNGLLMLLAVAATYDAATTPRDLLERTSAPVALALAGAAVLVASLFGLAWLVFELWRQQARLLLRIDALEATGAQGTAHRGHHHEASVAGPPVGTPAPDMAGADASGATVSLSHHWSNGGQTLFVFGDPGCAACITLYPELATWQAEQRSDRHVVVVTGATSAPHPELALFTEHHRSVSLAYGVHGTPSALFIDPAGRVASPLAEGADAIRALLFEPARPGPAQMAAPVRMSPRPAKAGKSLPDLELERIPVGSSPSNGGTNGTELFIFWNERCHHCLALADGLKERSGQLDGRPTLTFVVASPDQAQAASARLPETSALVDPEMRLSLALGVPGTPSAALVDGDGRLVTDLAVGPDAVLALLDGGGNSN